VVVVLVFDSLFVVQVVVVDIAVDIIVVVLSSVALCDVPCFLVNVK
jgi:hypothetical protein